MKKTLNQIIAERPEIGKMVFDKYKVEKKEGSCATHKNQRDGLRWAYAKRLIEEVKEKTEYK